MNTAMSGGDELALKRQRQVHRSQMEPVMTFEGVSQTHVAACCEDESTGTLIEQEPSEDVRQ